MDTTTLETSIVQIGEDTPTEKMLEAGDMIARLGEFLRDIKTAWEAKMIERIEAKGAIQDGDWLYRVGNPATTKCNDLPGAVEAILTHVGGDFTRFCEHLSSNAVKHGAAKQTLPADVYERLFTVTRESELDKTEATPRKLAKVNLAFVRPDRAVLPAGA